MKTNERVYDDSGVQIAELDVEVRGKVGSTSIAWLIECRDRPGDGPAPGSWIEQLVGRRTRFGFNKVTAVSTTGFAIGAIEFARSQGIELREVKTLIVDEFKDWLAIRYVHNVETRTVLQGASILVDESESDESTRALLDAMADTPATATFLKPSKGGSAVPLADARSWLPSRQPERSLMTWSRMAPEKPLNCASGTQTTKTISSWRRPSGRFECTPSFFKVNSM